MEEIFRRRSIRKYTEQKIPDEIVEYLLRAAMAAPSAGNEQPWYFIVCDKQEIFDKIPEYHPYSNMVPHAALVILVCGDTKLEKYPGYWVQDCAAATQNILLAATAKGIGSVWLGIHPMKFREDGMRKLFNIPEKVVPFSLISLGYPAEFKEPADRFNADRIKKNTW